MQSELKGQTEHRRWQRWGLLILVLRNTSPLKKKIVLFFWLCWGCGAERGLSLVVAGGAPLWLWLLTVEAALVVEWGSGERGLR